MVSDVKLSECLDRLSVLKWFPTKTAALAEIGKMLNAECADDKAADNVVKRILAECGEWPGPVTFKQYLAAERPQAYFDGSYLTRKDPKVGA